jgi:asparagine synthetase B (glutamine-hydrolysing)
MRLRVPTPGRHRALRTLLSPHKPSCSTDLVEAFQWFRWDRYLSGRRPMIGLVLLRETFLDAVRLRLGGDQATQAFLSGGLDSRSVATAVAATGATLYTYNFSWPGSYDQVLGLAYARAIGAIHRESPLPTHLGAEAWPGLMARPWSAGRYCKRRAGVAGCLVGDGGSVGLGRVY